MDFEMFGASSGGGSGIGEFGSCLTNFLDQGSLESHRYYLARRTALEMLRDRGYAVPNSEIDLSLHQFRSKYGQDPDPDRLRISTFLLNDPSTKILVIFCGPGVISDLIVNITKHELKPMHRILTDEEKHRLLKKHNLEEKQLPRMLLQDAIARYYGLQKGQVVKVTYSGEITGNHVSYRCVW